MKIAPNHEKLQYCGRIDFDQPLAPVMVYAGSFVKIRFVGSRICVNLANHRAYWSNYMGVLVDGEQSKILLADSNEEKSYVLAENLPVKEHEVMLFKRMDACHYVTFFGFEVDDDARILDCEKLPERKIEVFGDSVSCGEVAEALDFVGKPDPKHDGEFSNSWYSYSWMTARKLHARVHITSQGGIALMDGTGWFCMPDTLGVESCFDKITYNPQCGLPIKKWEFSGYQPHVVVLAFGQNDSNPLDYMESDYEGEQARLWRKRYRAFVEKLMELYPKAHFILTTTLLCHGASWDQAIDDVCKSMNHPRVHHLLYQRNGSATPGHLRIPEAEEMAEELAAYMEGLGDIWNEKNESWGECNEIECCN